MSQSVSAFAARNAALIATLLMLPPFRFSFAAIRIQARVFVSAGKMRCQIALRSPTLWDSKFNDEANAPHEGSIQGAAHVGPRFATRGYDSRRCRI